MSSSLRKKVRKKKKKKPDNNEIVPQRHEREGNLNYYSEEIAKNMLEKIISLAISSNFTQNVENKFDQYCINIMSKKINTLVEMVHINREKDDFDIDNIDIQTYIKYNETDTNVKRYKNNIHKKAWKRRNENAEDNLMEFANIAKDYKAYMNVNDKTIEDCLNNSMDTPKNQYLKKNKYYQYNIDINKLNFWGDIPQPKNIHIDRTTSNFNCYIPKKEDKNKDSTSSSRRKSKSPSKSLQKKTSHYYKFYKHFSTKNYSYSLSKGKDNMEDENSSKKKRIILAANLPSFPIENFEVRKESEEILNLRKEKLELIHQREKELQELKQNKMKLRSEIDKEKKKKKGKYTYDNEGKLILINEIKPESMLKEFWPVMSKQKEIKPGKTLEAAKREKIKMENMAKKNIQYNEEDRPYKLYLIKTRINESFYDLNKDNDKDKENSNDGLNNTQKESKKKNNNDIFDIFYAEPSGSNFQIMNPSVGVKIQEKSKIKSGGTNFYEYFHKYSINEFNKTLQDTIEWTKYKLKEKQNEGFMISTNPLPNLKKMISIKEEKENSGINTIDSKITIKNYKKLNSKKIFQKTFTDGFQKNKSLIKSKSEIYSSNEKFPKLKKLLLHEDQNEKMIQLKMEQNKVKEFENILGNRKQSSKGSVINKSMIERKKIDNKKYSEMDNFNKKLIMGMAVPERTNNRKIVLPKISFRESGGMNFNKTMTMFHRARTKKVIMDENSDNKAKEEKNKKTKGAKKYYPVKMIE